MLILFHSVVLIVQFMTFSVAMNSKRSNALIALLIASNFVEIKGACVHSLLNLIPGWGNLNSRMLVCSAVEKWPSNPMLYAPAAGNDLSMIVAELILCAGELAAAGTIFKRFDPSKLFVLVGQDVTERFHLALSLLFVLVVRPSLHEGDHIEYVECPNPTAACCDKAC